MGTRTSEMTETLAYENRKSREKWAFGVTASEIVGDADAIQALRKTLAVTPNTADMEVATVAALLLCNACLMHKRLRADGNLMAGLTRLESVASSRDPVGALIGPWRTIPERDFEPIFRPALAVLDVLPRSEAVANAVHSVVECAVNWADEMGDLGYDHAGPLYHHTLSNVEGNSDQNVSKAESDGAYYTMHIAALLLAGLTLSRSIIDWSNREAVKRLRLLDPACGTGTLLMAALKVIKDRVVEAGSFTEDELPELHRHLVCNGIVGMDINYHATLLAASNLTLGAPSINYEGMNIHTMSHGEQPDGDVRLGSLEMLADAVRGKRSDLLSRAKHAPPMHDIERSEANSPGLENIDVVLMNPPFTSNKKRGRIYGETTTKRMQAREREIKERVSKTDRGAGAALDANSISTFFTPLAEAVASVRTGGLGKVLPATACTGAIGEHERKFLADRFHIEAVVTNHHQKDVNFSIGAKIHESLLICRRRGNTPEDVPTRFVSLRKMPSSSAEVAELIAAIEHGGATNWCNTYDWPRERVAAGDWTPAQWYDGEMATVVPRLERSEALSRAELLATIEPAGQRVRDGFVSPTQSAINRGEATYPVMWEHDTDVRRKMLAEPDFQMSPKSHKHDYAVRVLWPKASRLLFALRIGTSNIRTPAVLLEKPALGSAWVPVTPLDSLPDQLGVMKAWCVYMNSTCGALSMLNGRSKTLTYSHNSMDHLRAFPLPDPSRCDIMPLVRVFDDLSEEELEPWPLMDADPVRKLLDDAVANCIGLDPVELASWRRRIVAEPSVSKQPAPLSPSAWRN